MQTTDVHADQVVYRPLLSPPWDRVAGASPHADDGGGHHDPGQADWVRVFRKRVRAAITTVASQGGVGLRQADSAEGRAVVQVYAHGLWEATAGRRAAMSGKIIQVRTGCAPEARASLVGWIALVAEVAGPLLPGQKYDEASSWEGLVPRWCGAVAAPAGILLRGCIMNDGWYYEGQCGCQYFLASDGTIEKGPHGEQ